MEYLKLIKDLSQINKETKKRSSMLFLFPIGLFLLIIATIYLLNQPVDKVNFDLDVEANSVTFWSDERQVLKDLIIKYPIIRGFEKVEIDKTANGIIINDYADTISVSGNVWMYLIFGKKGSIYNLSKSKNKDRFILRISGIEKRNDDEKALVIFEIGQKKLIQSNRTIITAPRSRLLCTVSPEIPNFIEVEFSLDSGLERSIVDQIQARSPNFESFLFFQKRDILMNHGRPFIKAPSI